MRLTVRQVLGCFGLGFLLALWQTFSPPRGPSIIGAPLFFAGRVGVTFVCVVVAMVYNLIANRKRKRDSAPKT